MRAMSGSFDDSGPSHRHRPAAAGGAAAPRGAAFAGIDEPITGPTGPRTGLGAPSGGPQLQHDEVGTTLPPRELFAPSRQPDHSGDLGSAPIVEAGSVTGRSLTLVISIMCFLACLTAGAVYMMNQSATAWLNNMSNEITVQIEVTDNADVEQTIREVVAFLHLQRGISTVNPLDTAETAKLLEPWLGKTDSLADLPVPRLIAIEIDTAGPPDLDRLGQTLQERFPAARLDDHRQWRRQIKTVTRSFALGGFAILILVGAATVAIIVSATASAMAANRDIVEVLNFVGATDRFIAHEFEKHFLTLGIRAGLLGAVCAVAVFWLMPVGMQFLGGGAVSVSELNRLVGVGSLDLIGHLLLVVVVVVIAALCMLTSRFGVYRILHHQN